MEQVAIRFIITSANNTALWYSPSNRLQNASGTWGSKTFYYDGVGNRIEERVTPPGGSETISTLGYPATSNRVTQITQGATTVRSIGYDAAGSITSDSRLGSLYAYTYNDTNRLKTVAYEGNLKGTYTYNGLHQLITRIVTNSGTADGTTHYVHDRGGNVIAELDASGASVREYIWLPEAEIAPTMASRAPIDRPIATVDGISGGSPTLYYVHTDHLHRPVKMSDASKAFVWQAEYQPRAPIVRARPIGRTSASVNRQRHQIGLGAEPIGSVSARLTLRRPCHWSTFGKPMLSVVPTRSGLALQLAPPLRFEPRPLHPARPPRVCGWAECLWVCEGQSISVDPAPNGYSFIS